MSAKVSQFPKRYTSYKVCFILYPNTPKVYLTVQCPFNKLDDLLKDLMQLPQEEVYFYEVHGCLADGTVEVVRGDISKAEPRGSLSVRHTVLVVPGSVAAIKLKEASLKCIEEQKAKQKQRYKPVSPAAPATPVASSLPAPVAKVADMVSTALAKIAGTTEPNRDDFKTVRTVAIYIEDFK